MVLYTQLLIFAKSLNTCFHSRLHTLRAKVDWAEPQSNAANAMEATFGDTTITDLLNVPRHRRPLCKFPNQPE